MKFLSLLSFMSLTSFVVGCDDHGPGVPAGSPCADLNQVSLVDCASTSGAVTDEACVPLDDAIRNGRAMTNDARAPSVTAPTEMQSLPPATPFAFTWTAPVSLRPRYRPMTVGDELRRWVTLIPEAEAHCDAFSGRAYELRFKVGDAVVLRRQQSATSWTPSAAEWARLSTAAGTRTVELTVYTATYTSNQIGAGNGPFVQSAPRRFTLTR